MQEHLFEHFRNEGHSSFFGNVSIHLKQIVRILKKRENYWTRTLKTYALFGLRIEDSVGPIPFRGKNVTGGLNIFWHQ